MLNKIYINNTHSICAISSPILFFLPTIFDCYYSNTIEVGEPTNNTTI
jgi:hypothetical protein